jgi:peptide deformylase
MAKSLPLVTLPTPSLRSRSVEVDPKDIGTTEFQSFLDNLIETMFVEDGVGIAAPQVGRNQRIFIVNEKKKGATAYINPEVEIIGDLTEDSEEGCLSVPGVWGMVKRAKKVHVKALDRHGRRVEFDMKAFPAIVFQHEFDHLEGILFIDKAYKILKGKEKTAVR